MSLPGITSTDVGVAEEGVVEGGPHLADAASGASQRNVLLRVGVHAGSAKNERATSRD